MTTARPFPHDREAALFTGESLFDIEQKFEQAEQLAVELLVRIHELKAHNRRLSYRVLHLQRQQADLLVAVDEAMDC